MAEEPFPEPHQMVEAVYFGHNDVRQIPYDTIEIDEAGQRHPLLSMPGYRFVEVIGPNYRYMAVSDKIGNPNG